jgi:hypothetical protein
VLGSDIQQVRIIHLTAHVKRVLQPKFAHAFANSAFGKSMATQDAPTSPLSMGFQSFMAVGV